MGTMCHPIAPQKFSKLCFKAFKRKALSAHPSSPGTHSFFCFYILQSHLVHKRIKKLLFPMAALTKEYLKYILSSAVP